MHSGGRCTMPSLLHRCRHQCASPATAAMQSQRTVKQRATHLEEMLDHAAPQEDHVAGFVRQPKSIEGTREREGGEHQDLLVHGGHLLETGRALLLRTLVRVHRVSPLHVCVKMSPC